MSTEYSGNAALFPATVTLPADGVEYITAQSVNDGLEDLSDRTAYLAQSVGIPVASWSLPGVTLPTGVGTMANTGSSIPRRLVAYSPLGPSASYGGKAPTYVAGGGVDKLAYSHDLRNWTAVTPSGAASVNINTVVSNQAGTFLAGGENKNVIYRSTDYGVTFAVSSALTGFAASEGPSDIIWVPALSLFVLASSTGQILTSPDGLTWTARTEFVTPGSAGATEPRLSASAAGVIFCTFGGGTSAAQKSTDGITWTSVTMPVSSNWFGNTYIPSLSIWVASSFSGRVYTSPDLTNWTLRYTSPAGGGLTALNIDSIGPFIVGADVASAETTYGRVFFSTDSGVTWRREGVCSAGLRSIQRIGNRLAATTATGLLYVSNICGTSDLADL